MGSNERELTADFFFARTRLDTGLVQLLSLQQVSESWSRAASVAAAGVGELACWGVFSCQVAVVVDRFLEQTRCARV